MTNEGDFIEIRIVGKTTTKESGGQLVTDEIVMDSPPFSVLAPLLKNEKPRPRPNRCAPLDRLNPPPPDDNK